MKKDTCKARRAHICQIALIVLTALLLHGCSGKRVVPPYPGTPEQPQYPTSPTYPGYPTEFPGEPTQLPEDLPMEQPITVAPIAPEPTLEAPPSETGAAAALYQTARESLKKSEYKQAEMTMERALRIEPRNGYYWYTMAQIKYRQQDYSQAINLCLKSKSFAGQDLNLIEINDSLIENSRRKLVQ
ncbi:tetratricopeptide repeat protein [Desulfosediminicola ganghwensis]|uniref:tetratricopeptide repeat protein n=1 Tax=Desulfosediminicola ganghwensis TaxID=2569540 RepID=UPI0010ACFBA2|nr:hypothetical protein [Desulfosediminicola ganghwensis]